MILMGLCNTWNGYLHPINDVKCWFWQPIVNFKMLQNVKSLTSSEISSISTGFVWSATLVVCSADSSKAVVPVLVLLFGALWFILQGDLLYVLLCAILFLCFSVLLAMRLPRLGKRELILVLFVRLINLCLFGSVGFLFLLMFGKACGLWFWHSLDFSLTFCLQTWW